MQESATSAYISQTSENLPGIRASGAQERDPEQSGYLSDFKVSPFSMSYPLLLLYKLLKREPLPWMSLERMAPTKKGGKKKGRSAINKVVTQEYTINIHKHIHGMGFKKRAP
ncbi:hypothetical protein ACRRTK_003906 [Alexandromys fortis]